MVKYGLSRKCKSDITKKSRISSKQTTLSKQTTISKQAPITKKSRISSKQLTTSKKESKSKESKSKQAIPNRKKYVISNIYDREVIPQVEKNLICSKQKWNCNLCGQMFQTSIIIDHIKPLFLGGENNLHNYQGLCNMCNKIKTNVIDYKLERMFITGQIKEADMTTDYIINQQKNYFKSRDYKSFI